MKVMVLGGAGRVGRLVVAEALERGHEVLALVRNAAKLANLRHPNLTVMPGDALDDRVLQRISLGYDAVVQAIGAPAARATTVFSDSTKVLLEVMKTNGIKRLVAITGIGAGDSKGHGGFVYDNIVYPLFTKPLYEDKTRQEELIKASGLDWVIVRPVSFVEGPSRPGVLRVATKLDGVTMTEVSVGDVAKFTVDQLTSNEYLHQTPLIGY